MRFNLHFYTDNAEFEGDTQVAIADYLRRVADTLETATQYPSADGGWKYKSLLDINGNYIGTYNLSNHTLPEEAK